MGVDRNDRPEFNGFVKSLFYEVCLRERVDSEYFLIPSDPDIPDEILKDCTPWYTKMTFFFG